MGPWYHILETCIQQQQLSIKDMAKTLNVSTSYLYYMLKGKKPAASTEKIRQLMDYLQRHNIAPDLIAILLSRIIDEKKQRYQIDQLEHYQTQLLTKTNPTALDNPLDPLDHHILQYLNTITIQDKKIMLSLMRKNTPQ